jgi:hypothetical protein
MGCALFVPGIYLFRFVVEWPQSWWVRTNIAIALLIQPVLVVAAVWTYRSLPPACRDWLKLLGSATYAVFLFALFWEVYDPVPRRILDHEERAIESLRATSHSAARYAETFNGFYPENSSWWGANAKPDCRADGPFVIPTTSHEYGYVFEYHAVLADAPVRNCIVAKSYTITARPLVYHGTGLHSYFVNQDHGGFLIHSTTQDRPATVRDPVDWTDLKHHRPN